MTHLTPGQHLFLDEILPTGPNTPAAIRTAVAAFNADYATWCSANSSVATLIPMWSQFADANGVLQSQYDDGSGIHLSQAGVNLMAQIRQKATCILLFNFPHQPDGEPGGAAERHRQ